MVSIEKLYSLLYINTSEDCFKTAARKESPEQEAKKKLHGLPGQSLSFSFIINILWQGVFIRKPSSGGRFSPDHREKSILKGKCLYRWFSSASVMWNPFNPWIYYVNWSDCPGLLALSTRTGLLSQCNLPCLSMAHGQDLGTHARCLSYAPIPPWAWRLNV